jgi:hypothetical protein
MPQFARVTKLAIPALAALALALDARAADTPTTAPAVQAVIDCKAIADAAQRLACYDAAVGRMAEAQGAGDLVTLDREQRRTVRRQAFGFSLPALSMFDRGEKPEEADRVTETVAAASRDSTGHWIIRLSGGAVWRQTDDAAIMKPPHAGSTAVLRRGALGSFFMKVDGQLQIRVHRDS